MHKLFVTQVYQAPLKFDLKDLKKEMFQIEKADAEGRLWSEKNYKHGFTSYGSWDQLHQMSSTFAGLEKKIDRHVAKFCRALAFDLSQRRLKMDSIWINIMPPGAAHSSHLHPHSVISGTYYVEVPARASALKFEDPRLGLFMNSPLPVSGAPDECQRFFSLQPKSGDVVLFESWLKHEVPVNASKKPRLSISFNYGWS